MVWLLFPHRISTDRGPHRELNWGEVRDDYLKASGQASLQSDLQPKISETEMSWVREVTFQAKVLANSKAFR